MLRHTWMLQLRQLPNICFYRCVHVLLSICGYSAHLSPGTDQMICLERSIILNINLYLSWGIQIHHPHISNTSDLQRLNISRLCLCFCSSFLPDWPPPDQTSQEDAWKSSLNREDWLSAALKCWNRVYSGHVSQSKYPQRARQTKKQKSSQIKKCSRCSGQTNRISELWSAEERCCAAFRSRTDVLKCCWWLSKLWQK